MYRWVSWLFALIAATHFFAQPLGAAECGAPDAAQTQWQTAQAADVGLDQSLLCTLSRNLSQSLAKDIHSVLILRNGRLAFEWYGAGHDFPWGKVPGTYSYDAGTLHDERSISKSVISLLVGVALDRKLIGSVEDRFFDYLPEYSDLKRSGTEDIRIADLLTMRSGLAANEEVPYGDPDNTESLMALSPDPYRSVLERKQIDKPGETWRYDGGSTMLLAAILKHVTGMPVTAFAEEALFHPLGIENFEWIPLPRSGETAAYGSLRLAPRDLARIGQLVLDKGAWHGRQIVSAQWIEDSTAPRIEGWYPDRYGYHWWVGSSKASDGSAVGWVAGIGYRGQRLFIVPRYDLVMTVNGWMEAGHRSRTADLLEKFVLAGITE